MSQKTIPILPIADSTTESGLFVMDAKNKIYVRAVTGRFAAWRCIRKT